MLEQFVLELKRVLAAMERVPNRIGVLILSRPQLPEGTELVHLLTVGNRSYSAVACADSKHGSSK